MCTALCLITTFSIMWIHAGGHSYDILLSPSVWGWSVFIAVLISALVPLLKIGRHLSFAITMTLAFCLFANLVYYRSFHCQIPLSGYQLTVQVMTFVDSVLDEIEISDLMLLVIPVVGYILAICHCDYNLLIKINPIVFIFILIGFVIFSFNTPEKFATKFNRLKHTHGENEVIPVLYSPFANLADQFISSLQSPFSTSAIRIESIIKENRQSLINRSNGRKYNSIVIILLESFESFVIDLQIEGKEIASYLTQFSKEENALFVPVVIPEVGVGRSIDAQLIINCGLLPPEDELFCFNYAGNYFPSVAKVMKTGNEDVRSIDIISDMPSIYNQGVLSKSFGYDRLISRSEFITNPQTMVHVDDSVFFAQTKEKLSSGLWLTGESAAIQIVSYSTHQPFRLPRNSTKLEFNGVSEKLSKYLNAIHRTDNALKVFMDYLSRRDDYQSTLVIITGDHNVFSSKQYTDLGISKLSKYKEPCVPLIILNSEVRGKITEPKRQSAIYATILELLGITDAEWPGISQSIFSDDIGTEEKQELSKYIMRSDYFVN